jgi:hypothetical protein
MTDVPAPRPGTRRKAEKRKREPPRWPEAYRRGETLGSRYGSTDWEKANRRDIVRDQGSESVYLEPASPEKPAKKKRVKSKKTSTPPANAPRAKAKKKKKKKKKSAPDGKPAERRWNPSPAAQAIIEFRRLPPPERRAQLGAYEERVRASYKEDGRSLNEYVRRARAQQLARLRELAVPSRAEQVSKRKSSTRSGEGDFKISVSRDGRSDRFSIRWRPVRRIERWQVALKGRHGKEKAVVGPQAETEATLSGLRRPEGPFTIHLTGFDGDGVIRLRARRSLFAQPQGKRRPKTRQPKPKKRKRVGKGSIRNAASDSGKRSRVRLIS